MCDIGVPNSILTNVVLEHTSIIYIYCHCYSYGVDVLLKTMWCVQYCLLRLLK